MRCECDAKSDKRRMAKSEREVEKGGWKEREEGECKNEVGEARQRWQADDNASEKGERCEVGRGAAVWCARQKCVREMCVSTREAKGGEGLQCQSARAEREWAVLCELREREMENDVTASEERRAVLPGPSASVLFLRSNEPLQCFHPFSFLFILIRFELE